MSLYQNHILVIDLDGTLLRSDMLYESFWSAVSRNWQSVFVAIVILLKGKAALKRYLAQHSTVEVSTLPYDPQVIAYIKSWRNSGGRTILVTASDHVFARAVSDHLQLFDESHGSDGILNLKGEHKSVFLEKLYGKKRFVYMADSWADLSVWQCAAKAVTVNASASLRHQVESVSENVEHLSTVAKSVKPYIKALRPHQWLKNILVFLPMLAAHNFGLTTLLQSSIAFISFSLIASSVYVLNDLIDLAADRAHPRKRKRPFASGRIPIAHGGWMAAGLICLGSVASILIGWKFLFLILCYYILTIAYSIGLKKQIVIDVFVLAGLYTIRIIAGGIATKISLSVWLLGFSVFFFCSLASVKRQAELVDNAKRGYLKARGRGYHIDDLPIISMIGISAGYASVLVLALYINSPAVMVLYAHPETLWGVCIGLLYWITRTIMVTHRGNMHDDPVIYAVKDKISQITFLIILIFVMAGKMP